MFEVSKRGLLAGIVAALPLLGSAHSAWAIVPSLSDGNSTLSFNPQNSALSWIVDGVDQYGGTPAGSDQIQYFNGTSFVPLNGLTLQSSSFNGNIGSATLAGTLNNDNFTITVSAILSGGSAGSGASGISETIKVNNLGPTDAPGIQPAVAAAPLDFIVSDTVDLNLAATANNDTLTLSPSGAPNTAVQTDPTGVTFTYASTPTPSTFALIDGGSSSTDLGPKTGNEAFSFSWDLSLATGDTGIISITQSLTGPTKVVNAVPLPNSAGSALATLAGLGFVGLLRNKRLATI
jgi:hypothetical protein